VVGTISSDEESPLPTRILQIFHPPCPDPTPNAIDHLMDIKISPWNIAGVVNRQIQEAFWRMISPSIEGIQGIYHTIQAYVLGTNELNVD